MRRWMRHAVVPSMAVAAVVLCACQPIVYDLGTGVKSSEAQWRVAPIEVHDEPGLDIRLRGCNTVELTFDGADPPHDPLYETLRPTALVTDQAGTVLFDNRSPIGLTMPPGSRVVDTTDEGLPDRIFVPVGSAVGKLTIVAGCTSYPGYGSGGGFFWDFPPCVTSTRSCPAFVGGTARFVYPVP